MIAAALSQGWGGGAHLCELDFFRIYADFEGVAGVVSEFSGARYGLIRHVPEFGISCDFEHYVFPPAFGENIFPTESHQKLTHEWVGIDAPVGATVGGRVGVGIGIIECIRGKGFEVIVWKSSFAALEVRQ